MTSAETRSESLTAARSLTDIARQLADSAVASAARLTNGGKEIDAHQAHVSRLAQIATEAQAAAELTAYAESRADAGQADDLLDEQALIFAAEALHKARNAVEADPDTFAVGDAVTTTLAADEARNLIRNGLSVTRIAAVGRRVIDARGAFTAVLDDEIANMTRDHAREFARSEVAPIAQEMHRQDHLFPEDLIAKMAAIGLFGSSIPESYGGTEMGLLTMVVLTEELSTISLVAGSLITRSEILTRALLAGG
ncbi:MAG: acyl-CoA dehydrogenase family protein, partial [Chloroflexi bacterium]|nr:acyl-CoA dehydrogenase family protein [Chloroflexota bacterium]